MALSRLEWGEMYLTKGGVLERKFLGCVLNHCLMVQNGGYADPNQNQIAWAAHVSGCDAAEKSRISREAMEWGLGNNSNLQTQGDQLPDGDLDWIVGEYTKTWVAPT